MHLREWIIIELFWGFSRLKKKTWLESFPRFWINSKVPTPTSAPKFTQNSGTSPVAHRLKCSLSLAHTSIFKVPSWNRYQRGGLHRPKDMAFLFPWMVLYSHRSLDHLCSWSQKLGFNEFTLGAVWLWLKTLDPETRNGHVIFSTKPSKNQLMPL